MNANLRTACLLGGLVALAPLLAATPGAAMTSTLHTNVKAATISSLVYHCQYQGPYGNESYYCYGVIGTCYYAWYAPNANPDPHQPGARIVEADCGVTATLNLGNLPAGVVVDTVSLPSWAVVTGGATQLGTSLTQADSGVILVNTGNADTSCAEQRDGSFLCDGFQGATEQTWKTLRPASSPHPEDLVLSATQALLTVTSA